MPTILSNITVLNDGVLTCSISAGPAEVINCTGTLGANSSTTLQFRGTVPNTTDDGAVLINEATLTSPTIPQISLEAVAANNIIAGTLVVEKTNAPLIVASNGVATSTIIVTNHGNATANNVGIFDDLPDGASFVATGSTITCTAAGGLLTTVTGPVNNSATITVADGTKLLVDAIVSVGGNTRTVTAINGNSVTLSAAVTLANGVHNITYVGSSSAEVMCTATTPNASLSQGDSTTFTVKFNVGSVSSNTIKVNTACSSNSGNAAQVIPPFPNGCAQAAVTVLANVAGAGLVHVDVDAASESASHASVTPGSPNVSLDPNQVLHDTGSSESQPFLIDDIDDATGSLHTVCLLSPDYGLNDQQDIIWSILPAAGSQATVTPPGGTKVILNIQDALQSDSQANCVQWRSGGVGGQVITASHAITGQVFYASNTVATPLIKEWNDIDETKIVKVVGNIGTTLFQNTQDLASWKSLAAGGTCIRDADTWAPAATFCLSRPNVDGTTLSIAGASIVVGPNAGNLLAGNASFIDYTRGDHQGVTAEDYDGPIDGAKQTYTISGTCGSARVENPVDGVTDILVVGTSSTSTTILNSDKGVGFQIFANDDGSLVTDVNNADCSPGEWTRITITTQEDVQLRSDLDTAPVEWVEIHWTVAPPPQKQILLAWAGQRVILEHDWRINPAGPNGAAYDVAATSIPAAPATGNVCPWAGIDNDFFPDYFPVHYIKGAGPGNFLAGSLGADVNGADEAFVLVEPATDQVWDNDFPQDGNLNCISRVLYESEDPGEVDIEAFIDLDDGYDDTYYIYANYSKVAFVIYYMKFESIDISLVSQVSKTTHNGPSLIEPLEGNTTTLYDYADWSPGNPWDASLDDADDDVSWNVSKDLLIRGRVKGWFNNANPSGRAAVNDPGGNNSRPANRWVMPDDWDLLAGGPTGDEVYGTAEDFRPDYDLMMAPNNQGVGTGVPFLCATPIGGCSEHLGVVLTTGAFTLGANKVPAGSVVIATAQLYDVVAPVEGPLSLLDLRGPLSAALSNGPCLHNAVTMCGNPLLPRNTIVRDWDVDWWDAPMPAAIVSVDLRGSGFLKQVRKADVYWTGRANGHWGSVALGGQDFTNPYYIQNIPGSKHIPAAVAGGGYLWNSYGPDGVGGLGQGPYEFWQALPQFLGWALGTDVRSVNTNPLGVYDTSVSTNERIELQQIRAAYANLYSSTKEDAETLQDALAIGRTLVVFSDNHGEFMVAANGDFKLSYADCVTNVFGGGHHCDVNDVVGASTVYATVDYPDFRGKHFPIKSNTASITWTWAGYKEVTIEDGELDQFKYIVFHAKDRDGYCYLPEGVVSLHPVLTAADAHNLVGGSATYSATKTAATTLTQVVTAGASSITVASTTGLAIGDYIVIDNELLQILGISSGTQLTVVSLSGGVAHSSGAVVFKATNVTFGGADPVETVDFLIDSGEGIIVATSGGGSINDGKQFALGVTTFSTLLNTTIKEFPTLDGSADECQAWIRVSNSLLGILNVLTTAHDDEGNIGFDRIVDFSGTASYTLTFRWSLITWAGQDGISPNDALTGAVGDDSNDIIDQVTAVYGWNQSSQTWLGFFPAGVSVPGANDLIALDNGSAYWIAIKGPDPVTWTIATDID
jgi:uncharacterized repeat protein (TIGR01451 family)